MSLQSKLETYLTTTGTSQRALSLSAGLNPKAVSDILRRPGHRPRRTTLERLSRATQLDLCGLVNFDTRTWQDLMRDLERKRDAGDANCGRRAKRLQWLVGEAGWVASTQAICREDVLDFFAERTPASVGLTKGSFSTYKSDILAALKTDEKCARPRSVLDIGGPLGALYGQINDSDLSEDLKRASGPFIVYLHDRRLNASDVTTPILLEYNDHRRDVAGKAERACRKHVKRVAHLWSVLAGRSDFIAHGCHAVAHPFSDGRDRFGVSDAAIAPLMRAWDARVEPWARGQMSRTGQTRAAFIKALDAVEESVSDKKARLRAKLEARGKVYGDRKDGSQLRDEQLQSHGFLTVKNLWSVKTAAKRRSQIVALTKALNATTEFQIETIEELVDPEILGAAAAALAEANADGQYKSNYVSSVLKTVRKVAIGFIGCSSEDLNNLGNLILQYNMGCNGIAPRNKAKLQQFTKDRIQATIDFSDMMIRDVNGKIRKRRDAHRKKHGKLPTPISVVDPDLARDVMVALAHEIMLKRGPRSDNLLYIQLDWIAWLDGRATIVIPAIAIKGRAESDPDLPIPLGKHASQLLEVYLNEIRAVALLPEDDRNPYLFPGQNSEAGKRNEAYTGLLRRLVSVFHEKVGVRINPHLYRHLIGWIWLKDDIEHLPAVQKLLGHRSLQTTLSHYAEIDETLALDKWQERLDRSKQDTARSGIKV